MKRDREEADVVSTEEKQAKLDEEQKRLDEVLLNACWSLLVCCRGRF
jgi:hypothetical protein